MTEKVSKKITLGPADIENLFSEKLSPYLKNKIKEYALVYSHLAPTEFDACIIKIVNTLLSKRVIYSGQHRLNDWETGWGENLNKLNAKDDLSCVNPGYFGKYSIFRLKQKFIKAESPNFEKNTLSIIIEWLADKYMKSAEHIYEFGCGTGHHLLKIREYNKNAELYGLDWTTSSQKIIKKISEKINDKKIHAHRFDFFKPDKKLLLQKNSAVYTIASMEQTGQNYKKFINYLLKNKPQIVIHIEPIAELLDENNLLDFLSIQYFKKRRYLQGFLTYLKQLEKQGIVEIIKAQRSFIGSLFIDGYSVVVWRPKIKK